MFKKVGSFSFIEFSISFATMNISSIRQNLQVSYVNRLLSIVNIKSSFDNLSKTSAFYNLNWLKDNLDNKIGNLQTRQHKDYLLYLIDSLDNPK